MINLQQMLDVEISEDASRVWILKGHTRFAYSDGAASEAYLKTVLENARDLSAGSDELEAHIKDWPSEYHLSAKRTQLFSGFQFNRAARVLEVGCGCGAITRFLGETFNEVLAIEGSLDRARLAKQRTRDLPNVHIVCAPFQELRFKDKFDIIFCVGVLEYSASFVKAADPYDAVLRQFASWLSPAGLVVIAIENQFGLKYFNSFREDHLGARYEGLEGYHSRTASVRTFGRDELQRRIQSHFSQVAFYYPYPDYKLPSCIVDHDFLSGGEAGELVSQIPSRDYSSRSVGFWNEALVSHELARNGLLPTFSNSFLVLASDGATQQCAFEQSAILFSPDRLKQFRTVTRIARGTGGRLSVSKRLAAGVASVCSGPLKLTETGSDWKGGHSLQTLILQRCRNRSLDIEEIFVVCSGWLDVLRASARTRGGVSFLPGRFLDAIWSNFYVDSGKPEFIDEEWEWDRDIELNVVIIRAIYVLLCRIEGLGRLNRAMEARSGRVLIKRIAASLGVSLSVGDIDGFVALESEVQARIWGSSRARNARMLRWFLFDRGSLFRAKNMRQLGADLAERIRQKARSFASKG